MVGREGMKRGGGWRGKGGKGGGGVKGVKPLTST